jgi:hypothetical protein
MSALRLFCSRATRAFASFPPVATEFAFPRHITTYGTNAEVVKQYRDHIKAVMANSTLDEGQKYRFSKRLVTDLDLHIATHNSHLINEKIESARVQAENWEEIYDLRRKRIIISREVTFFRWKACKLYEEKLVYQAFTQQDQPNMNA